MPFTRLLLRDLGPFKDLHLDLTDGEGNPHLGPHILAGVNGSGKSTVLRALALGAPCGQPPESTCEQFEHFARSPEAEAICEGFTSTGQPLLAATRVSKTPQRPDLLPRWREVFSADSLSVLEGPSDQYRLEGLRFCRWPAEPSRRLRPNTNAIGAAFFVGAYRPSLRLQHLREESRRGAHTNALGEATAFEGAVDNERSQAWLREQYSMRAIAKDKGTSEDRFIAILERINSLLSEIFGQPVELDVDIGKTLELRFRFNHQSLNFSQLPDGVRYLLGLTVDFLRRRELADWDESVADKKPSVLLIDELDGHLHPKWQRAVLPALQKALPDVQIIVSTHSPFVISSCRDAKVHVLQLDEEGNASVRPPMDAPIGESLMATVQDVFGVESRFDVETERELGRWNDLQKRKSAARLTPDEQSELARLTAELAERSEELRMIVKPAAALSESALKVLLKDEVA
jgi:predicted ATP-binding protein involved in virulence